MPTRLATSSAPSLPLWRIRLQAIVWFVLVVAFVLGLPILLGWGYGLLTLLAFVSAVLAVASAWWLRRFSPIAAGRPFASVWSHALLGWTLILGILVAAPFYYLMVVTDTRPATVPQVALNNGSKRSTSG